MQKITWTCRKEQIGGSQRHGVGGGGQMDDSGQNNRLPIIRLISPEDVMYNMGTMKMLHFKKESYYDSCWTIKT